MDSFSLSSAISASPNFPAARAASSFSSSDAENPTFDVSTSRQSHARVNETNRILSIPRAKSHASPSRITRESIVILARDKTNGHTMPWERIVSLCLFRAVAVASRTLSSPSSSSTDGPRRVIVIARSSSRARASTCADDDAKFRPFGRARGGDGYMSLRFVFIDYTCTRVCTICPRRDGWDMDRLDRTHRTHSYSRHSYAHQWTH